MSKEQVSLTRTAVAAAVVSSTAIYLIYKKKIMRRQDEGCFMTPCCCNLPRLPGGSNMPFSRSPKIFWLLVLGLVAIAVLYQRDELEQYYPEWVKVPTFPSLSRLKQVLGRRQAVGNKPPKPLKIVGG